MINLNTVANGVHLLWTGQAAGGVVFHLGQLR